MELRERARRLRELLESTERMIERDGEHADPEDMDRLCHQYDAIRRDLDAAEAAIAATDYVPF